MTSQKVLDNLMQVTSRYYNYYCSRCEANTPIEKCPIYTSTNGRKYPICPSCGDKRRMKTTVSKKNKTLKRIREIDATRI
jgi:NAD-dependent SIR2 family protein deacetylase